MKKLGLIGGIGPESTVPYYRGIVYGVQSKVGKDFYPNLTIESLNVFNVLRMCRDKEHEALIEYLMVAINNLKSSGADFVAMSGNTPHIVLDELKKRSSIPLVSIVEVTCDEVKKLGFTKIGLLGTIFTMNEDFFKKPFVESQIQVITPSKEEKELINQKISNELELGIVNKETQAEFIKIVERMKVEEGIQAIVLGCTELPMLFNNHEMPVACLDTMKIHIEALINRIIEE